VTTKQRAVTEMGSSVTDSQVRWSFFDAMVHRKCNRIRDSMRRIELRCHLLSLEWFGTGQFDLMGARLSGATIHKQSDIEAAVPARDIPSDSQGLSNRVGKDSYWQT
jgi:hypothetical protein